MRRGEPVITRRIRLVEGAREAVGCLSFLPVYGGVAKPTDEAARIQALRGWVYASLRVNLLLRGWWRTSWNGGGYRGL